MPRFRHGRQAATRRWRVTGIGKIQGFPICIFAQDFTVAGGSLGLMHARKITKIMDHAMKLGVPLIGIIVYRAVSS